jgi:hypothetical protein
MTYGQFSNCLDGYHDRIAEQIKLTDISNHSLGLYVRTAFNSPSKYPRQPFSSEDAKPTLLTNEEREIVAKARHLARKMREETQNGDHSRRNSSANQGASQRLPETT